MVTSSVILNLLLQEEGDPLPIPLKAFHFKRAHNNEIKIGREKFFNFICENWGQINRIRVKNLEEINQKKILFVLET